MSDQREDKPAFGRTIPGPPNTAKPPGSQWRNYNPGRKTRKEAIHAHCYECNGTQAVNSFNDCVDDECDLYPYRPGRGHGTVKTQTARKPPKKTAATAKENKDDPKRYPQTYP